MAKQKTAELETASFDYSLSILEPYITSRDAYYAGNVLSGIASIAIRDRLPVVLNKPSTPAFRRQLAAAIDEAINRLQKTKNAFNL